MLSNYGILSINPFTSRAEIWVKAIERPDLLQKKLENLRICAQHFTDEMYNCPQSRMESNLRISAVPILSEYHITGTVFIILISCC